jgi:hypothetical protein
VAVDAALREAIASLLEARGELDLAALVRRASLELAPRSEGWRIGVRAVEAQGFALLCDPTDFARLSEHAEQLARIEASLADAVRTPTTELAGLALVLRLPVVDRSWASAYRDARAFEPPARPPPTSEQLLHAASALARALGDARAAEALEHAELEHEIVPSSGPPLLRYVLRLGAAELAHAERDRDLAALLERCLRHAATRVDRRVASVELRLRV